MTWITVEFASSLYIRFRQSRYSARGKEILEMARIVVIVGHVRTATCEALGESYARGARAGGHEVKLFVTSRMTFDPILHEGFERVQPLEHHLSEVHDAMLAADHLVLIFPLWLGTLPAILRGLALNRQFDLYE